MNRIELQNVCKAYGGQTVLNDLSAVFPDERPTCLMGPSGCGKTTLGRLLLGLEQPDSGKITGVPARKSAVFQEDRLFGHLSAVQNVRAVCPRGVSEQTITEHLLRLGLEEQSLHRPARELSGGMRRRAAIVRAVLHPSELLLLDEPFAGLDDARRAAALDYIACHAQGRILILITHDTADAQALGAGILRLALSKE